MVLCLNFGCGKAEKKYTVAEWSGKANNSPAVSRQTREEAKNRLKEFYAAVLSEDFEKARTFVISKTQEYGDAAVKSEIQSTASVVNFNKALIKQFGEQVFKIPCLNETQVKAVEKNPIKFFDDSNAVWGSDPKKMTKLSRIDGRWKIDYRPVGNGNPDPKLLKPLFDFAEFLESVTKRIESNEFETEQDVKAELAKF